MVFVVFPIVLSVNPEIQRVKRFASAQYCAPSFDLRRIVSDIPCWCLLAFLASAFSLGVCGVLGTILAPLFSTNFRNAQLTPTNSGVLSQTTSRHLFLVTASLRSIIGCIAVATSDFCVITLPSSFAEVVLLTVNV